ncbi:MAG: NAD(P)/FAD-dependent oxidoreductase [Arcanobacterium sp.]
MTESTPAQGKHHVVIIGSGFGGLFAAKEFAGRTDVKVTLVAKTDHHLFQPLLYQAATGILSVGEIAPSTREILRDQENVRVMLALVEDVDVENQVVKARNHDTLLDIPYDSLIVAAGARQSYFGNDHFEVFAPGLKTVDDALELRSRIFHAFERAEISSDPEDIKRLLTFIVVGGGPTGVEMAGQIRELASFTLDREFRKIDPKQARVILVQGDHEVLHTFGNRLGGKARHALEKLGIEVRLNSFVTDVNREGVEITDKNGEKEFIRSYCKVWAAGVAGMPIGAKVADAAGGEVDRAGRVIVEPTLNVAGHDNLYVVGDLMSVPNVPGVAQGAIQSGQYTARRIKAILDGDTAKASIPFKYHDKGSMAIISKYKGIADINGIKFSGYPAWAAWLIVHIMFLVGFKSRVSTLLRWFITFLSDRRAERVTTNQLLVARLAMKHLGPKVSGPLLRGESLASVEEHSEEDDRD